MRLTPLLWCLPLLACTTPAPTPDPAPKETPEASKVRPLPDVRVVLRERGALFACVADLSPEELQARTTLLEGLSPEQVLEVTDERLPVRLRSESSHLVIGPGVRAKAPVKGVALDVAGDLPAYFLKLEVGGDMPGGLALAVRSEDAVERTRGRAPKTGPLSDGDLAVVRKLLIENAQGPVPDDLPQTFQDGREVTAYIGNFPGDLRLLVRLDWEIEAPEAGESEDAPLWHFSALLFLDRKGQVAHWVHEPKARPHAFDLELFTDLNDDGLEEIIVEARDSENHQIDLLAPTAKAYEAPRTLLTLEGSK